MINETQTNSIKNETYFEIPNEYTQVKKMNYPTDINLAKKVKEDYRAIPNFNEFKIVERNNKSTLDFKRDHKSKLDVNLLKGVKGDNDSVLDFNLYKEVRGDDKSVNFSGLVSNYGSVKKTNFGYATFYNNIDKIGEYGFAVQFSVFHNQVKKISDKACLIQIGLTNKREGRYSLIFGVKGLKNIPEIIKKRFSKNKENGLETKLGENLKWQTKHRKKL